MQKLDVKVGKAMSVCLSNPLGFLISGHQCGYGHGINCTPSGESNDDSTGAAVGRALGGCAVVPVIIIVAVLLGKK